MYEANDRERASLVLDYGYNPEMIERLDTISDEIRRGITTDFMTTVGICEYQTDLQAIRKAQKRWWQFWK